ncbi:MAG: GNAT family N-acetyltransferase [Flavobacteriaceae bacterium]|nr:GNAT family N-acetyltransferase [Flavobacteriaceae bacterium]MDH3796101.1 GNAT family N-acetyltransferase [Flavobacteriaceae bacterium]
MLLDGHRTDRIHFRKLVESDFQLWLPFYLDPKSTEFWEGLPRDPVVACTEQFQRQFERYEKKIGGMNALIDIKSGELAGICGLLLQEVEGKEEWEIGYSLMPQFRGKGYATEAAQYCKSIAFENQLAPSLISMIHVDNLPSQAVAERNGMNRDSEMIYKENPIYIYRVWP